GAHARREADVAVPWVRARDQVIAGRAFRRDQRRAGAGTGLGRLAVRVVRAVVSVVVARAADRGLREAAHAGAGTARDFVIAVRVGLGALAFVRALQIGDAGTSRSDRALEDVGARLVGVVVEPFERARPVGVRIGALARSTAV